MNRLTKSGYIQPVNEGAMDSELAKIAKQFLDISPLKARNSDEPDFYDVGVVSVKKALEAAYNAGKKSK